MSIASASSTGVSAILFTATLGCRYGMLLTTIPEAVLVQILIQSVRQCLITRFKRPKIIIDGKHPRRLECEIIIDRSGTCWSRRNRRRWLCGGRALCRVQKVAQALAGTRRWWRKSKGRSNGKSKGQRLSPAAPAAEPSHSAQQA